MEDDTLVLLRETAVRLVRGCKDEDLLDLVCKLFMESACAFDPLTPQYNSDAQYSQ